MLEPEIEDALNKQFNQEQTAAQEYLAMAAYFDHQNFAGFAAFMRAQADEEREHALRFFDHVCERGGHARLGAVPAPAADFASPKAVFETAYELEKANTREINGIYELAGRHGDYATQTMLQWFITEQVEEEQWCEEAIALLEKAGDSQPALLMLDGRYGKMTQESGRKG